MQYTFKPSVTKIGKVNRIEPVSVIEAEPMLYDCDLDHAYKLGGRLTTSILKQLACYRQCSEFQRQWNDPNLHVHVDTKSVMLMPEFYPCIGGWHCDAVPRPDGKSQPDLGLMRDDLYHYLCVIPSNPGLSNTQLIVEDVTVDLDENSYVWRSVNSAIKSMSKVLIMEAEDGDIIRFNQPTIHRGQPSTGHGWRYFFRLIFTDKKPANKIRHQVQVYTSPDTSW
jgi:hypothetical protein